MSNQKMPPIGSVVRNRFGIDELYQGTSKNRRKIQELVPGEGIYSAHPYGALLLGDDVEAVIIICRHTPTHGKWSVQIGAEVMVLPSAAEVDMKVPVLTACNLTTDQLGMTSPDGAPIYVHVIKQETEDAVQN